MSLADDVRALKKAVAELLKLVLNARAGGGGGGGAHNILSATHSDTTIAAVTRGALITGIGLVPKWTRLGVGGAGNYLQTDGIDVGWAALSIAGLDHGLLAGLADDDHAIYAYLAGRPGGQILYGGVNAGDDLTLRSTSNVGKGTIFFAAGGAFDEVNSRLGIGILAPTTDFHIQKGATATALIESTAVDSQPQLQLKNDVQTWSIAIGSTIENLLFYDSTVGAGRGYIAAGTGCLWWAQGIYVYGTATARFLELRADTTAHIGDVIWHDLGSDEEWLAYSIGTHSAADADHWKLQNYHTSTVRYYPIDIYPQTPTDMLVLNTVGTCIGADAANEMLTVYGRLSLKETTPPALTAGYGKIYVKSADSLPYFMDDSGNEYAMSSGFPTIAAAYYHGDGTNTYFGVKCTYAAAVYVFSTWTGVGVVAAYADTYGPWRQYLLTNTSYGGLRTFSADYVCGDWENEAWFQIMTSNDLTLQRIYFGFYSGAASNADDIYNAEYCGIRYSSAVGGNWYAVSKDSGGVASASDTGLAVVANTVYYIRIKFSSARVLSWYITPAGGATTSGTKATNMPLAATLMGVAMQGWGIGVSRYIYLGYCWVEWEH